VQPAPAYLAADGPGALGSQREGVVAEVDGPGAQVGVPLHLVHHGDRVAHPHLLAELDRHATRLADGLVEVAAQAGIPIHVSRVGSLLTLFFVDHPVTNFSSASDADADRFAAFFRAARSAAVLVPPSMFEAWFVSTTHTASIIDTTLEAIRSALGISRMATPEMS